MAAAGNAATAGNVAKKMADSVLNANRSVWLVLQNSTKFNLCHPCWYGKKGRIHENMSYCIKPESVANFDFRKAYWGVMGAEGVLKYQIGDMPDKNLFIFYSNPYVGYNKFSLWFSESPKVDKEMCTLMLQTAWPACNPVTWHTTEEDKVKNYRDTIFKASGYCSQGECASLLVTLTEK